MGDDVVLVHILHSLIDALGRVVLLREAEVVLMHFECNTCGGNDDVLDAVHVLEHPIIIGMVGPGITKKHPVKSVHEVVATEVTGRGGVGGERRENNG